ncbi:hypothetical protein [Kitasatospora kifunensis]|uniref:Uncharacterized protein n=1 Tax=Kitasatospora kifunensis TaxID=58351 RepID=A0A7W7VX47_KITKI|nr:hypothetical protein [Kitasatospora kifunensis]MBB4925349.1 hypothetical protein [Kitasatospora kifunensis]
MVVESARWPLVWTGFLLMAMSVRLAVTVRTHRHRRIGAGRRPSYLEWLPGLAGLIVVVAELPRILRLDGTVLALAQDFVRLACAGVFGLLLYGGVVLARRLRG